MRCGPVCIRSWWLSYLVIPEPILWDEIGVLQMETVSVLDIGVSMDVLWAESTGNTHEFQLGLLPALVGLRRNPCFQYPVSRMYRHHNIVVAFVAYG